MSAQETDRAMRAMAETGLPPEDAAATAARRRRVVAAMERAMRDARALEAARRRSRSRIAAVSLAAAALVGIGVAVGTRFATRAVPAPVASSAGPLLKANGPVTLVHAGGALSTSGDSVGLVDGDQVATADAGSSIVMPSGATATLARATTITVATSEAGREALALREGEIEVHVPKLRPSGSFVVATDDARVVVHGTWFTVRVTPGATPRTRVVVHEGVVSVEPVATQTVVLLAGGVWPNDAAAVSSASSGATAPSHGLKPPIHPGPAAAPASSLGAENAAFQSAIEARKQHNDALAVTKLGEFLAKYPGSPLTQEARIERFRALERLGRHAAAVAEARRYLVDYPAGSAREEAKALVLR